MASRPGHGAGAAKTMSIHLPATVPDPCDAAAPRSSPQDAAASDAVEKATQRIFAAAAARPLPPLENLEPPSAAEQPALGERLELLDLFGEAALDPLLPPAQPERRLRRAEDDPVVERRGRRSA